MKKLIIITGVSGTGKTSLSKILYNKIENSVLLSYDKLAENLYDIVGFKDKDQKKSLRLLKIEIYKKLINECMQRKDEVIILEQPFKIEWKDFLEKISAKYEYDVYTINMFAKNFDTIWNRLLKREKSRQERHPAHYLNSYCFKKKDEYAPYFEYDYDTLKEEYDNLRSNCINLGNVININDLENLDIENLINTIMTK